ncbi:MAG: hypothetical protein L7F78_17500, partial [Syntrophales bacterium LBB04]|nr:hypothetical protein [Syntrophales bacterium LBB04]
MKICFSPHPGSKGAHDFGLLPLWDRGQVCPDHHSSHDQSQGCPTAKGAFPAPFRLSAQAEVAKLGVKRGMRRSSPPGRYAALLMAGCQDTEHSYDAYFEGRPNGAFSFVA